MNLFTLADGRKTFYQWDLGRKLIVNDDTCSEVHFCNGSSDCSLVCEVKEQDGKRVVDVPNILLQESRNITAFAFVCVEGAGFTRRAVMFPVVARTKPSDYVYTETEILSYKKLVYEVEEMLKQWHEDLFGENSITGAIEQDIDDLQDAVAKIQADLAYVAIDITAISNDVTNDIAEIGSTIPAVAISWAVNKEPTSQTVDGNPVEASARSAVFHDVATDRTWTVTATDERDATDTAKTSVRFLNGLYYGSMPRNATIDSEALLKLKKKLHSTKTLEFSVTPGEGERPVYACPTRYGNPTFKIGGFEYEWEKITPKTFNFTNASGYTESYAVWMHGQEVTGSITINVT